MDNSFLIRAVSIKSPLIDSVESSSLPEIIEKYLTDESWSIRGEAEKIFFPESEGEVSTVLKWASKTKTPVTVSGGGTGITGSRVPLRGVVLSTEKLLKAENIDEPGFIPLVFDSPAGEILLGFNEQNNSLIAPPGITLNDLYKFLSERNLFYPPNPTELSATLGGNIATNASGGRTFRDGSLRKWIKRLRIILPTGELLDIKRGEVFAHDGKFILEYPDGSSVNIPVPGYKMPNVKNASGYYAKHGMDLIDLFIGAEGTLGVVTEVQLDVIKWEGEIFGCITFFKDEEESIDFVEEARRLSRSENEIIDALTLDYFDENSLKFMEKSHPNIPRGADGAVFLEQLLPGDPDDVLCSWMDLMEKYNSLEDWTAMNAREREKLREFRHSLPESVNELMHHRGLRKMGMDLAVPDDCLREMMKEYHKAGKENGIDYVLFGHIGNNNLHMNFLPKDKDEMKKVKKVYLELARKGISLGGTISAEHGVGKKKLVVDNEEVPYLYLMYGDEGLESIRKTKQSIDKEFILNRGNIIS